MLTRYHMARVQLLSLMNNDLTFATGLGLWHMVVGLLLSYCLSIGGTSHKVLIPFAVHDFIAGLALLWLAAQRHRAQAA